MLRPKIALADTETLERGDFTGFVYVPKEAGVGFNAMRINLQGRHPHKRMVDTTRVYFVISGEGRFTIRDEVYKASPNDVFVIEPGVDYCYEGSMKLFEFNVSPDNSFKDEKLE